MKTTLELPDDLMRRVKLRAVHANRKLKDEIAQLLVAGLAHTPDVSAPRKPPKPARLRRGDRLTISDIEAAIAAGRE